VVYQTNELKIESLFLPMGRVESLGRAVPDGVRGAARLQHDVCKLGFGDGRSAAWRVPAIASVPRWTIWADHGRFLQRRDSRGQAIVTLRGDIGLLERNEAQPRNLLPCVRVGWRGIGYWRPADSDLRDLGVNFRRI
jgi:hypothetical protein